LDGLLRYRENNNSSLEKLPNNKIPGHPAVFIGEVKLPDLKQVLMKNGFHVKNSFFDLSTKNFLLVSKTIFFFFRLSLLVVC
jgi:hypothetical protein